MNDTKTTMRRPVDPAVSIYPLAMSARRARHEARQAKRHRLNLPKGHPYRHLPLCTPYGLARWLNRSESVVNENGAWLR